MNLGFNSFTSWPTLHTPPEFSGDCVLNAGLRCNIQVQSIMKAQQMYIYGFVVTAMNSRVFQCTLRWRLARKLRRAPINSSVQASGFPELSKKYVWVENRAIHSG